MTRRMITPADGTSSIIVSWDHSTTSIRAGVILDVAPGSALETALGTSNLTVLAGTPLAGKLAASDGIATAN